MSSSAVYLPVWGEWHTMLIRRRAGVGGSLLLGTAFFFWVFVFSIPSFQIAREAIWNNQDAAAAISAGLLGGIVLLLILLRHRQGEANKTQLRASVKMIPAVSPIADLDGPVHAQVRGNLD